MNQPIELQSIGDLSQYVENMNKKHTFGEESKLYLYVFNKNSDACHLHIDTTKDGRYLSHQYVQCHIEAGTMHFGRPINVKQDVGDIIHLEYAVIHELKPGATRFETISRKIEENPDGTHNTFRMAANPIMFEEVRVFDIGDIGYELSDITPEQAAEKYFGVSDFRQFFSNYAAASKQMSLKNHPHVRRYYDHDDDLRSHVGLSRIAPKGIQLTGMHPVKPSSLREYLKAGKQLLIRQKGLAGAAAGAGASAAFAAGIGAAAAAAAGAGAADRRFSAMAMAAMSSFPLLGTIHSRIREQQELNALQRKKTVALTNEERKKLFAKGALASELTRRLTTTPSQSRPDLFKHIHSTVHQKPKSARIHWSPGKKGGRKIRRTRKK